MRIIVILLLTLIIGCNKSKPSGPDENIIDTTTIYGSWKKITNENNASSFTYLCIKENDSIYIWGKSDFHNYYSKFIGNISYYGTNDDTLYRIKSKNIDIMGLKPYNDSLSFGTEILIKIDNDSLPAESPYLKIVDSTIFDSNITDIYLRNGIYYYFKDSSIYSLDNNNESKFLDLNQLDSLVFDSLDTLILINTDDSNLVILYKNTIFIFTLNTKELLYRINSTPYRISSIAINGDNLFCYSSELEALYYFKNDNLNSFNFNKLNVCLSEDNALINPVSLALIDSTTLVYNSIGIRLPIFGFSGLNITNDLIYSTYRSDLLFSLKCKLIYDGSQYWIADYNNDLKKMILYKLAQ